MTWAIPAVSPDFARLIVLGLYRHTAVSLPPSFLPSFPPTEYYMLVAGTLVGVPLLSIPRVWSISTMESTVCTKYSARTFCSLSSLHVVQALGFSPPPSSSAPPPLPSPPQPSPALPCPALPCKRNLSLHPCFHPTFDCFFAPLDCDRPRGAASNCYDDLLLYTLSVVGTHWSPDGS